MTYAEGMKQAILHDWTCGVKFDCVSGNGFEITWYGVKLIIKYILQFIFRVVFALLFPISAVLMIRIDRTENKRKKSVKRKADDLHK